MRTATRAVVLACASFAALAFSASALGAYTPRMAVLHESMRLGASGQTAIEVQTARTDEATAKVTINVPPGYTVTAGQAAGTRLGTAEATVQARAVSPDVFLPVQGVIQADSPSNWTAQSTLCTGTATHENVWVLVLTASGRELRVPMFVDHTVGAATAFSSFALQVCLPPPDIPEPAGGAAFGAKLVDALLTFNAGIFTTPRSADTHLWIAYFTPWTNFKPPSNATGTIQARAVVPLPQTITIKVKFNRKNHTVTITGTIRVPGVSMQGVRLNLRAGTRAAALRANGATSKVSQRGTFSAKRKIRRSTFFQVLVIGILDADQEGCAVASPAPAGPAGCTATVSVFAVSRTAKAAFRR